MSKTLRRRMRDMEEKVGAKDQPQVSVNWDPDHKPEPGTIVIHWNADDTITREVVK